MLRSAAWDVAVYASAEQFISDANRSKVELLITDIQMQGMDGFDLIKSVKLWSRPIPVICVTAFATPEFSVRANACGAAGFFSKPIDDETLLALIGELLDAP
jgi:FixJ family two-component response regulator